MNYERQAEPKRLAHLEREGNRYGKQVGGSFSISGIEDFMNSGRQQVINLWDGKMEGLESDSQLEINRQLFGDGTGNLTKDLDGLGIAVEDGTVWSNYGQIDSNVETWWRNVWISAGDYTTGTVLEDNMRKGFNSASRGAEKPNLILMSQVVYEKFESTLTVKEQFIKDGSFGAELAQAGFRNLEFKGAWAIFDDDIQPNVAGQRTVLMLNTKYLRFVGGLDRMFAVTDFQRPDNQDAWVALVLSYCNIVTKNRARQARIQFTGA